MSTSHYAISEVLIVIAAMWCVWQYTRSQKWLAAIGTAIFGTAAAIGAYRYGAGQLSEFVEVHQWMSQTGCSIAMILIAVQILKAVPAISKRVPAKVLIGLLPIPILVVLVFNTLSVPLFILWLVVAIVGAFMLPSPSGGVRVIRAAMVGLMLINLIVIRQSPALDPAISWHLFHGLVALWLLFVMVVIKTKSTISNVLEPHQ